MHRQSQINTCSEKRSSRQSSANLYPCCCAVLLLINSTRTAVYWAEALGATINIIRTANLYPGIVAYQGPGACYVRSFSCLLTFPTGGHPPAAARRHYRNQLLYCCTQAGRSSFEKKTGTSRAATYMIENRKSKIESVYDIVMIKNARGLF